MVRDLKLEHLAGVSLFTTLNKKELGLVARASEEAVVPAGTVLVEEGSAGHEFYLILEGRAIVRRGARRVAMLGPASTSGSCRCSTVPPATPPSSPTPG